MRYQKEDLFRIEMPPKSDVHPKSWTLNLLTRMSSVLRRAHFQF